MLIDSDKLKAEACRRSFYHFFLEFWDVMCQDELVENWHIKYLCDEMQKVAERVFANQPKEYDLVINISPGTSKSSICTRAFPIWCWTRKPDFVSICASYSSTLAEKLSRESRDIVRSDKFKLLFPEIEIRRDCDGVQLFKNTKGGERMAVGVGGTVIGSHAHCILIDDPLNTTAASSEKDLQTANDWINEGISTRKKDKKITPTILIMQRLHQWDCSAAMLERKRVKHINLPGEDDGTVEIKPKKLKRFYKDGLFDPIRLDREVLASLFDELKEYGYACQIRQTPIPKGGGMFKTDRIITEPVEPRSINFTKIIRSWDKAASHERGCYTVGAKMAVDTVGYFWILHIERFQKDSFDREETMKQTAIQDGKNVTIILEEEGGSGGKHSAAASVRNLAGWNVICNKPETKKEIRADPFATQVNAGNVKMVAGNWNGVLTDEMKFFPNSKYKDQVDALSQGFAHLVEDDVFIGVI